jgi:hypothetical protein
MVMPFGIANAPDSSQNWINEIVKDMIDFGVVAYIADILIYIQTIEDPEKLINKVLIHLQKWDLLISINRCEFHKSEIEFLSYMIADIGINMAQENVHTVLEWEHPSAPERCSDLYGTHKVLTLHH